MPDIFDQIASQTQASPIRQPDVFDAVAAQTQTARQPDIFDHVAAVMQPQQTQTTVSPIVDRIIADEEAKRGTPFTPAERLDMRANLNTQLQGHAQPAPQPAAPVQPPPTGAGSAPQSGIGNFLTTAVSTAAEPMANLIGRGLNAAGLISDERLQQGIETHPLPYDPQRLSGKLGGVAGTVGQAMTGPAAPAIMAASAGSNAIDEVERRVAGGQDISNLGAATDVAAQAAINAIMAKLAPGQKINAATIKYLTPTLENAAANAIKNTLVSGGIHAGEGVIQNLASNAVTKHTGVNPKLDVTENSGEAAAIGGAFGVMGQGLHEITKAGEPRPVHTETPPAAEPETPAPKTEPEKHVAGIEEAYRRLNEAKAQLKSGGPNPEVEKTVDHTAAEIQSKLMDYESVAGEDAAENLRQRLEAPAADQTAKPSAAPTESTHPAELSDAKQVGEWYGKTFNDPANAQTIEALASMHPGKYKLVDVPVDQIDPNVMMGGDTIRSKVDAIKGMTPEERAKLPPVIAIGEGDKLMIADGTHRLTAAKEAGEKTIQAYVPESFQGDVSKLKRFVAGEPAPAAKEVSTSVTDSGKKIAFTAEDGQQQKGTYLSTTMEKGFHWVKDEHGATHRVPESAITVLDRKLPLISGRREMSYTQLKDAARKAGYVGVDGPPNLRSLHRFLTKQRADSFTDLPKPPREMSTTMGLKSLRHWAEESGYNLEGVENLRDARATVRKQYAHSILEGRKQGSTQNIDEIGPNAPIVKTAVSKAMEKPEVKQAMRETPRRNALVRGFEDIATPLDSQVKDISPRIYGKMQKALEYEPRANAGRLVRGLVEPAKQLTDALGGKGSEKYNDFRLALRNQDFDTARKLVGPDNESAFNKFTEAFAESRKRAIDNGVKVPFLSDYWPSHLKDYEGFRKEYGKNQGQFEDAWDLAEARQGGKPLTDEQRVEIANQVQQGFGPRKPGVGGPGNSKTRSIETITKDQLPHYGDPFESAFKYIETMERSAGRAKFLGKSDAPGAVSESVGKMLQEEIDAGKLDREGQRQLKTLLTTRLNGEYLTPSKAIRTFKEATYLTHITSLRSGINQLTDLATTASRFGAEATAKGLKTALGPADRRVLNDTLGLSANGEEFKDPGKLAKVLNLATKTNLFQKIDRLTKDVHSEAAWESFQKAAKNPESEAYRRFERDYREALGTETWDKAVADAREGKRTMESGLIPFMALTEVQPLTLNQMPPAYLRMRNGRVFYALKTFTASALNNVRRQTFSKLATPGQRAEGLANLAKMLVIVGGANFGKELIGDMMRGKDIDADSIKDDSANALLNMIALSRYTVGKATEKPTDALTSFIMPPVPLADSIVHDTLHATDKKGEFKGLALAANLPIVGDVAYYWTPLGRGWYLNESEAKKEWNTKLAELKTEADAAGVEGDTAAQSMLMAIYNEKSKSGPNPTLTQSATGRAPEFKPKSNLTAGGLAAARQRQLMNAKRKEATR